MKQLNKKLTSFILATALASGVIFSGCTSSAASCDSEQCMNNQSTINKVVQGCPASSCRAE